MEKIPVVIMIRIALQFIFPDLNLRRKIFGQINKYFLSKY